jgi:hypothetical protein
MYVVHVLPEALLFSNLQFYEGTLYVYTYVYCTTLYESTFVRKYFHRYFRTSGSIFVRRYYVYVYRRYYVYVYSCSSAAVMYESTFVLSYESIENRKSCSVVHYQK